MLLCGAIEQQAANHLLVRVQRAYPIARAITLDLTDVTFINSHGLYVLLQIKAICSEHDIDLVLYTTVQDATTVRDAAPARGRSGARRQWGRKLAQLLIVTVLATTATLVAGSPALAIITQVNGHPLSYQSAPTPTQSAALLTQPAPTTLPAPTTKSAPGTQPEGISRKPLEYHGGPVMSSNANYTLYWNPPGAPPYPEGYETGIDKYFEDLSHDSGGLMNIDSVLTQYGDSAGEYANYDSRFAAALVDTDPYPVNGCSAAAICLTDEQIRAELTAYVEAHGLPADLQHEYFVLTPPEVESCFESQSRSCSAGTKHATYCSYHSFISAKIGTIVYANTPYMEGTNCDTGEEHPNDNPSDATLGGGLVHEHAESLTDPELNAWYDSKGDEVADKCRTFKVSSEFGEPLGKAPDGSNYNQLIDGDPYWYQQVWSNQTGACEQRVGKAERAPTVTKVSPKKGSVAGGTTVTVTGTEFVGAVSVYFGTAAAKVEASSSTSLTVVSPAGSAGTVNVTVKTPSGTSAITKKDLFKYKASK